MNNTNLKPRMRLLTAAEVAEQLGWSLSTLYRKRSLQEPLPAVTVIGSSLRWTQEAIDDFIAVNTEQVQ
ncbi:MAG: helix-turn-helix transcriptional regulator [Leucobacter sp.]|uniref:helix-turn-helix transcriptional regulator n=1 Tax=Agrococcus casei TaxID=343512 RepID=UPI003F92B578